ncbi:unnamed protein product, partial [Hapterophycus canaliculatus]
TINLRCTGRIRYLKSFVFLCIGVVLLRRSVAAILFFQYVPASGRRVGELFSDTSFQQEAPPVLNSSPDETHARKARDGMMIMRMAKVGVATSSDVFFWNGNGFFGSQKNKFECAAEADHPQFSLFDFFVNAKYFIFIV